MKQKYTLSRNLESRQLVIQEFGELDKDIMSLLCEEAFDDPMITEAISKGHSALIGVLRSDNLYPPSIHAEKIAEAVTALYQSESQETVDILIDDRALLARENMETVQLDELKEDVDIEDDDKSDELDDLLDDDDIKIKSASATLKIADDDTIDIADDA